MTSKKQKNIISLSNYRQKKALLDKNTNSSKSNQKTPAQIFYMSNYLKTKKIPNIKDLKKEKDRVFTPSLDKEITMNNIISLDQYRKEKNRQRVWKKQLPKEALSVAGMAFLFLFTFNLAVSIQSSSPSKAFSPGGPVARGKIIQHSPKEKARGIASSKENKKTALSRKKWIQKIKSIDRKNITIGKKAKASDYTGF